MFTIGGMTVPVLLVIGSAALVIVLIAITHGRKRSGQPPGRRPDSAPQRPPVPEPDRAALARTLRETMLRAEEARALRPYAELFGDLAAPFQWLLGFAELRAGDAPAWASPEQIRSGLRQHVAEPVTRALDRAGARLEGGRAVFPPTPKAALPDDFEQRTPGFSENELRRAIDKYQSEIRDLRIWERQKRVVLDLDGLYGKLAALGGEDGDLPRLAGQVRAAMEKSGISPMFYSDPRLAAHPALRERFVPVSDRQLRYPGLFYEENGRLEQLGMYSGTCTKEEQQLWV